MFSLKDRKSPREETAKLTATYVNGMAIGIAVVGGISPLINVMVFGGSSIPFGLSPVCIGGSLALHLGARWYLKREFSR